MQDSQDLENRPDLRILPAPIKLSEMERRAVQGLEPREQEILRRHAIELHGFYADKKAMLEEIAEAHGLPLDCWEKGLGIDMGEWEIVQMLGFGGT